MNPSKETLELRLRLAHQARRAKEHQLDGIRRALCDVGIIQDDDPYGHADLEDVIRQQFADDSRPGSGVHRRCGRLCRFAAGEEYLPLRKKNKLQDGGNKYDLGFVPTYREGDPEPPAEPTEPSATRDVCCVCGSSAVVYRNYQDKPFCSPCAEGNTTR